jgi:hypothetical protein
MEDQMHFEDAYKLNILGQVENGLSGFRMPDTPPFVGDLYLGKSQLQKAIRRGLFGHARSAAGFLINANERAFWTRLAVVASEDIGVANMDLVTAVALLASDKRLRTRLGGSKRVADYLVWEMCRSAKDRSTDDLYSLLAISGNVPTGGDEFDRHNLAGAVSRIYDHEVPFVAAMSEVQPLLFEGKAKEPFGHKVADWEPAHSMLTEQTGCGCSRAAAEIGLRRTGLVLFAYLPFLAVRLDTPTTDTHPDFVPPETLIDGVPSWVLGGHTRAGRRAFSMYLARSRTFATLAKDTRTGELSNNDIVANLVFQIESGCVNERLQWDLGLDLKHQVETTGWGIPDPIVPEAKAILLDEFDLLNECRAQALADYLR